MKLAWKLASAYALRHPARMLLTFLAMTASAAMVVWVVGSYDALAAQTGHQAAEVLGRYDFFIVPEDPKQPTLDLDLVAALRQDAAVAEVDPAVQAPIDRLINPNAMPGNGARPPSAVNGGAQPPSAVPSYSSRPGAAGLQDRQGKDSYAKRPAGPGRFGPIATPMLVGTDAPEPPYPLLEGHWIKADPSLDPKRPEHRGVAISKTAAEQHGLKIGDEALVVFGTKEYRIRIVGLVEDGPMQMGLGGRMRPPGSKAPRTGIEAGPASSAVYVSIAVAKHFMASPLYHGAQPPSAVPSDSSRPGAAGLQERPGAAGLPINLINVRLEPEAKQRPAAFRKTWEARIAQTQPAASLLGVGDIRSAINEGMTAARAKQEAWAAAGLSLLAALFIIFTTLSMGVTERVRQFAVMRAVGLTRGQVAAVIALEGMILALIGWAGGLLAGWGLLALVARYQTDLFRSGASLGVWCVTLTGLSAFGGALAASILPAYRATRVEPLEALAPRSAPKPNRFLAGAFAAVGLALVAVNPILVYAASASISADRLYYIYMAVGCTTMAVGFLLLTPAMILLVESGLSPWIARLLGLDPRLLRCQLGGNLWRTLGTTAALTVGLGLFAAIQIWGYSMLEPFKPGAWNPDMLVAFQLGGLPEREIAAVRAIEGVRPGRCIPLAVEQPKLASDITGSERRQSVISQNNVIMIGLDPEIAFGGDDPLVPVRFVEGDPAEIIPKLKEGRYCIVPDHFLRAANLKLGDRFAMVPPDAPAKRVEYTIVGAVSLPGWHWMTKFSGLRRREGRSAAMVFADYDAVRRDFELNQINFLWLDVDEKFGEKHLDEVRKAEKAKKTAAEAAAMRSKTGGKTALGKTMPGASTLVFETPIDAKRAAVVKIGEALQAIAERNPGERQPVNMQGMWSMGATMFGPSVRVTTPDDIMVFITARASGIIWASCYLPLITLAITSLGVVNAVMASVRARRWEFGILRSQGVTRSGLFRIILAEGLLIGLLTCLLSLGFGVLSGWCGTGISQYVSFFGGLAPPLVIPWPQLSVGFGLALGLCLLAALWPAVATGRTEPMQLLQEGRAAM